MYICRFNIVMVDFIQSAYIGIGRRGMSANDTTLHPNIQVHKLIYLYIKFETSFKTI